MKNKIIYKLIICIFCTILLTQNISYAKEQKYNTYVSLGDSITSGYGLKDTNDRFSIKLKEYYNISDENYYDISEKGMKASELYDILRDPKNTEVIKKADLITINIGSNELLEIVEENFTRISGITYSEMATLENFNNIFQSKFQGNTAQKVKQVLELLSELYDVLASDDVQKELKDRIDIYKVEWIKSIEYIKEINPDATIVVIGFYNPYYNVVLLDDFGEVCQYFIDSFNEVLYDLSENETKYRIASIVDDFNTDNPRLTNVSLDLSDFYSLSVDPHPTIEGHKVIAKKVEEAINKEIIIPNSNNSNTNNTIIYISIIVLAVFVVIISIIVIKKKKNKN